MILTQILIMMGGKINLISIGEVKNKIVEGGRMVKLFIASKH